MTRHFPHSVRTLLLAASLASAACGASGSLSPTAPTSVVPGTGAVITGRVTGGTSSSSSQLMRIGGDLVGPGGSQTAATTASDQITVTIVGTSTSTTVGPTGEFTLTGVPTGSVQLQFTGRGSTATVAISGIEAAEHIEISVTISGSTAKVESENRRRDENRRVEVNGRVTAVGTGTLQVGTTLVTLSPTTVIRHGSRNLTLADIKIGDKVEIKGTRDTAGITATEVKVEDDRDDDSDAAPSSSSNGGKDKPGTGSSGSSKGDDDDDDDEDEDEDDDKDGKDGRDDEDDDEDDDDSGELKGAVASLGGSACPALTFVIKGVTVTTSASTKFDDITCSAIKVGTSLEVKGTRTGTTMTATKVERD